MSQINRDYSWGDKINIMNVAILTTNNDPSAQLFQQVATSQLKVSILQYDSLVTQGDFLTELDIYDKLVLRDPYNSGSDFSNILQSVVRAIPHKILIDLECYVAYPKYEDKLFQADLYNKFEIPHPTTSHKIDIKELQNYPYILKKRLSSRNRGNYVITQLPDFNNTP